MRKRSGRAAVAARNPAAAHRNPVELGTPLTERWWFNSVTTWASLFCVVFIAYLPALRGGRLWDDSSHITRPELQSLHGLWRIWFDFGATQQYYPVLHSAFWFEHRIWGDSVFGYHLINVVLHAIAATLVVFIARCLKLAGSLLAGFLFALHPVCVESVAWMSEQKSTLSGVFCLAAILCYLNFENRRRVIFYLLAISLFVLALLSKSVTAVAPVILLVIAWWRRGRLNPRDDLAPLVPWLAMGASMGLVTAWIEKTYIGPGGAVDALTIPQHLILTGRMIVFYVSKLVAPVHLSFSYTRWKIPADDPWQYFFPLVVIATMVILFRKARYARGPLAGFLIFIIALFPVLGFLGVYPFRYSWVADHFQYLACLGLIVPFSVLVSTSLSRYFREKLFATASASFLVIFLGVLTWQQSSIYRNEETIYRDTVLRNPDSWLGHNNMGTIMLSQAGRVPEAIQEFRTAVRLEPAFAESHFNLASAYAHDTPPRLSEAISEYEIAARLKPDDSDAPRNLGNVLMLLPGRRDDAIRAYRKAVQVGPDLPLTHQNLGSALAQNLDTLPEAIGEFQIALRLSPGSPELHANLGSALAQSGRLTEAVKELGTAAQLQPDAAMIHYNLGNALEQVPGRLSDALNEFRTAANLQPDFVEAQQAISEVESMLRRQKTP